MLNIQGVANKPVLIGDVEKYKIEKKNTKKPDSKTRNKTKEQLPNKKAL